MTKEFKVVDPAGLHARPVSLLVDLAMKFDGEVNITYKEKSVSLKSILLVMSLGVPTNEVFSLEVINGDVAFLNDAEALLKDQKVI